MKIQANLHDKNSTINRLFIVGATAIYLEQLKPNVINSMGLSSVETKHLQTAIQTARKYATQLRQTLASLKANGINEKDIKNLKALIKTGLEFITRMHIKLGPERWDQLTRNILNKKASTLDHAFLKKYGLSLDDIRQFYTSMATTTGVGTTPEAKADNKEAILKTISRPNVAKNTLNSKRDVMNSVKSDLAKMYSATHMYGHIKDMPIILSSSKTYKGAYNMTNANDLTTARIKIQKPLLLASDGTMQDTIAHEVGHALDYAHNKPSINDPKFNAYANLYRKEFKRLINGKVLPSYLDTAYWRSNKEIFARTIAHNYMDTKHNGSTSDIDNKVIQGAVRKAADAYLAHLANTNKQIAEPVIDDSMPRVWDKVYINGGVEFKTNTPGSDKIESKWPNYIRGSKNDKYRVLKTSDDTSIHLVSEGKGVQSVRLNFEPKDNTAKYYTTAKRKNLGDRLIQFIRN